MGKKVAKQEKLYEFYENNKRKGPGPLPPPPPPPPPPVAFSTPPTPPKPKLIITEDSSTDVEEEREVSMQVEVSSCLLRQGADLLSQILTQRKTLKTAAIREEEEKESGIGRELGLEETLQKALKTFRGEVGGWEEEEEEDEENWLD